MKLRYIFTVAAALLLGLSLSAQTPKLQARASIAEFEDEVSHFEVFPLDMGNGQKQYYLCLGRIYHGDDIVQVGIDPVSEMFVYLGGTMDEAIATMESMLPWFELPNGSVNEVEGIITVIQPSGKNGILKVKSLKPLLTRNLEFYEERDGYIIAASISRSAFKNLVSGVKFYRKLHPKQL